MRVKNVKIKTKTDQINNKLIKTSTLSKKRDDKNKRFKLESINALINHTQICILTKYDNAIFMFSSPKIYYF